VGHSVYSITLHHFRVTLVSVEFFVYHWATCHCSQYKIIELCRMLLVWWIYTTRNNKMYLGLHVKFHFWYMKFPNIFSCNSLA